MGASSTEYGYVESSHAQVEIHRWLWAAVFNWLLVGLTFVLLAQLSWPARLWFIPPALVVIGTRQHALALLAHDAAHYLCCRDRRLNDLLATLLCAFPLGASLRSYRQFHLAHHRYAGTAKDPEFEFKKGMSPRWNLPTSRKRIFIQAAKDCLGLGLPDILHSLKTLKPIDLKDWIYYGTFWIAGVGLLALGGLLWCLVVWMVALITVQWAAFRIRIWTEHAGLAPGQTHRLAAPLWQRMFLFPVNTWCHYEHHESVSTPFYRLPALRRQMTGTPVITVAELFRRLSGMPASPSGTVPVVDDRSTAHHAPA